MVKCNSEEVARDIARERNLRYGFSVFDGKWYVGTEEQLKSVGVADVQ